MIRVFIVYVNFLQNIYLAQFCKEIFEAFNETSYSLILKCKFKTEIAETNEQHK